MAKYKPYNYAQTRMVPVDLENQLMAGTLEHAIHYLVDNHINMKIFDEKFKNDETGAPGFDPRIMLKIVLNGYSHDIFSSRKLERASRENIIFMALGCGQTPDHSTIADFITSMKDEIIEVFRNILLVCDRQGLLGGTNFALDGLKLPSNASKEWSGTHVELKAKKEKFEEKLEKVITRHQKTDKKEDKEEDREESGKRERQIRKLQRGIEKIDCFLKENAPKQGKKRGERKSNVTDNDSCKMVTTHGTIQGYNGQAMIDNKHQVIIAAEVSGKGQDFDHAVMMIDVTKENVKSIGYGEDYLKGKELTADSNYHSMENLKKCKEEKIDAYIPDVYFRKRDPRFKDQGKYKPPRKKKSFKIEDFTYDEDHDQYICPEGQKLTLLTECTRIGYHDYRCYRAPEGVCPKCRFRKRCINSPTTKRKYLSIDLGKPPENLSQQMIEKIDSEEGKRRYEKRISIVEPVFGNIRHNKGLNRFNLRSKPKVNIQWLLFCMVHNIEKIVNFGTGFA